MPSPYYYSSKKIEIYTQSLFDDVPIDESAETQRVCQKCNSLKPMQDYYKDRDGYQLNCKICSNIIGKITRNLHKTAPPKPTVCDCCGEIPSSRFVLDHDHNTGKFRGWICERCNIGLGKLGDTVESLERATEYLKRTTKINCETSLFDGMPDDIT